MLRCGSKHLEIIPSTGESGLFFLELPSSSCEGVQCEGVRGVVLGPV